MGFPKLKISSRGNSARSLVKICVYFFAALFVSCSSEKLAGTEVGNPELTVAARFAFTGNADSVSITDFNVKCMGLNYQNVGNSSDSIWAWPNGMMVDMADSTGNNGLGLMKINSSSWKSATMRLKYPSQNLTLPDSEGFELFSNPHYAKIITMSGNEKLKFLFELPADKEVKLSFNSSHIKPWVHNDTLTVEILFDAGKWSDFFTSITPWQIRKDGLGSPYILLTPQENINSFNRLNAMLPQCFLADSVNTK